MNNDRNHMGHLTPETIRAYLDSKMDSAAMHRIETHLLECEFCADAVEGFELSEHSHVRTDQALLALRRDLNKKIREHDRPRIMRWPVWSAAAGIALAIAGYVVIKQQEREEKLAAIRQSEAFLQTGVNDTLIIFLPNENDPLGSEGLLASNISSESAHAGLASTELNTRRPGAATTPRQADHAAPDQSAEKRVAATPIAARPDSPQTGDTVVIVASGTQKRSSMTGSVVIQGDGRTISGRVVDSDNRSLPGASLMVPGTILGTATDAQGNFTLDIPDDAHSLVVRLLGFEPDTVRISQDADHLLLAMQPAKQGLEEVVVVGYSKKGGQLPPTPSIGKEAYEQYLSDSLRYPEKALRMQIEGEVLVGFTVRGSGRPAAFKVVRSLGYGCDQEAVRLIREGPAWVSPVRKQGRRHPAEAVQAVKFELPDKD